MLNAILNYRGGSLEGAKLYVSLFPCNECAKAIIQAGIKTVIYDCDKYEHTPSVIASKRMLDAAGVRYYKYNRTGRKINLDENAKCRGVFRILSNILLAVTPIIVFEIVQMITVLSVRYKMSQLRTARQIVTRLFSMEMKYQLYNLVIYYALFAVMILIFRKAKVAAVVYTVALVTAALVNYYVIMFRGQPFMLLDIVGMGTAAEVVGEYQFRMPKLLALTMVAVLCFLVIQLIFQRFELGDKSARNRIMRWGVLGLVAIALWQSYPKVQKMENVLLWSVNSDHINKGYMYTLLRELRYFTVEKPEGYSAEAVDAIAEKYTEDTEDTEAVQADKDTVQATNIIMIMNESLVDFEEVGDLKANKEILPYIRSMDRCMYQRLAEERQDRSMRL